MAPTLPSASKLLDDADVLVALPGGVGRRAYAATLDHHPAAAGAGEGGAGEGGGTGRGRRTVLSVTSVVVRGGQARAAGAPARQRRGAAAAAAAQGARYEEWEGLDDAARDVEVARSMRGEAERERATVRRLAGCKAWAPLDHELGAAAVARVGPSGAYPCVVLEAGRGKLLHELLPLDGCGGDADADGGKGGGGLPSPAQLDAHLSVIRDAALGAMHAVAQAWEMGPRTRYGLFCFSIIFADTPLAALDCTCFLTM